MSSTIQTDVGTGMVFVFSTKHLGAFFILGILLTSRHYSGRHLGRISVRPCHCFTIAIFLSKLNLRQLRSIPDISHRHHIFTWCQIILNYCQKFLYFMRFSEKLKLKKQKKSKLVSSNIISITTTTTTTTAIKIVNT